MHVTQKKCIVLYLLYAVVEEDAAPIVARADAIPVARVVVDLTDSPPEPTPAPRAKKAKEWDPRDYLVPKTVASNSLLRVMGRGHHRRVGVVVSASAVPALSITVNVGGRRIESTVKHTSSSSEEEFVCSYMTIIINT